MSDLAGVLKMQSALTEAAPKLKQLKDACTGMEAAFMKTLVSQMRKGAGDVHFGQEFGGDIYRDMFDDTLSNLLAEKQGTEMVNEMAAPMAKQVEGYFLGKQSATAAANNVDNKEITN
jgi:Rod binding domain-containing protein